MLGLTDDCCGAKVSTFLFQDENFTSRSLSSASLLRCSLLPSGLQQGLRFLASSDLFLHNHGQLFVNVFFPILDTAIRLVIFC